MAAHRHGQREFKSDGIAGVSETAMCSLSTLQLMSGAQVRKTYQRACLVVHPDKVRVLVV